MQPEISIITRYFRVLRQVPAVVLALAATSAHAADLPAPIQALERQGVQVGEAFEAPAGLTGYTLSARGQTVTVYVLPDGEHAVIGTLIDRDGTDLSRNRVEEAASKPRDPRIWDRLADSRWIPDGSRNAERKVYVFSDPNCPYCHGFWKAARPWVKRGEVQLRHVMVGIIGPDSAPKAATLLAAADPSRALTDHELAFSSGGVTPRNDLPASAREAVRRNSQLMQNLGFFATPTIVYRNAEGEIRQHQGQPRGEDLIRIMGGPPG